MTIVLIDGAGPSFSAGYDLSRPAQETKPHGWVESEHFGGVDRQFARASCRELAGSLWILFG